MFMARTILIKQFECLSIWWVGSTLKLHTYEFIFFLFFFYQEQKYKTRQKLKKKEKTLYKDSTPYLYLNSSKGRADEDNIIRKEKYLEKSYNKI